MSDRRDVIVVGGGIAGIAAALRLAQSGVRVLLLETRRKLGGRATSFTDPRTGAVIDNCQHVALGCCANYLDLCDHLGVADLIEWHDEIHWVEAGGRRSVMRPGFGPAPAHFAGSLLGAGFLSAGEKAAITCAMTAALFTDRARHEGETFASWLARRAPSAGAMRKFWEPLIVSACNLSPERVCAATALHVLQEGFLANRASARMGVSRVPLLRLYDAAEGVIAEAGGEVRLGAGVESATADSVRTTAGETLEATRVVLALPPERAAKVVDPAIREADDRFAGFERMTHSPILGVHLAFDRPVMDTPNAVLVERGTQWLFRKDGEGRVVHAVISAADEWVPLTEERIRDRVLEDIRACFPGAADAAVESVRAVKEKRATFAATPEDEAARPDTEGASGLILAGDAVRTGWPATMEGATISGYLAAGAVLARPREAMLKPALRPSVVVRAVGANGLRNQHRHAAEARTA